MLRFVHSTNMWPVLNAMGISHSPSLSRIYLRPKSNVRYSSRISTPISNGMSAFMICSLIGMCVSFGIGSLTCIIPSLSFLHRWFEILVVILLWLYPFQSSSHTLMPVLFRWQIVPLHNLNSTRQMSENCRDIFPYPSLLYTFFTRGVYFSVELGPIFSFSFLFLAVGL